MKSLDQIRAAHAARFWGSDAGKALAKNGAEVAAHLPALVAQGGLLPVLAQAKSYGEAWEVLMAEVGRFLSSADMKVLPPMPPTLDSFIAMLTGDRGDALTLQRATAEALWYLSFLKRLTRATTPRNPAAAG
jgi:hypothetical protein